MTRVGDTKYVVRRRPCGCLLSTKPAKDQEAAVEGATHTHMDKSISTVYTLRVAATVPEWCAAHAATRPARTAEKGAA